MIQYDIVLGVSQIIKKLTTDIVKTILLELFPVKSHHLMAFKTAKLLQSAGHRVIFGSMPKMKGIIQNNGFEYVHIPYAVIVPIEEHLRLKKDGIKLPSNDECLKIAHNNFDLLSKQINGLQPDIVLLDKHLPPDKLFYYKHLGIKVSFVCVMPDPSKATNIPPFSSGFIPRSNLLSKKYVAYLWALDNLKGKLNLLSVLLAYPVNEVGVFIKLFKELGLDPNELRKQRKNGEKQQLSIPRIILSASDLEFPRPQLEGVHHLGPLIDFPKEDYQSTDMRYEAVKSIISKSSASIIYCSLGMLADFCTRKKISLYRKIRKVALLSPDDIFILCTGDDLNNSDLLPLPPNMFVFRSLPQKDLLKYCTLMINHGGLNSITECVFSEVPVIAYPPSPQADHSCNAAKVVYHGIGLRGKIGQDSPLIILKKINKIRKNYDWYLGNIRQMKQKFEAKNNSTEVVNIIESIIDSHDSSKI